MSDTSYDKCLNQLILASQWLDQRGLVPATSGNLSARISEHEVLISASGVHKGRLTENDFLKIRLDGELPDANSRKPSAETLLHLQLYRHMPQVNLVLHPHSVKSTVLSRKLSQHLQLNGYELQKAFTGISSHECALTLPVFSNDQDIARLADAVEPFLDSNKPEMPAYLIRGHGYYCWGRDLDEVQRHIEALEFLFECHLLSREN